MAEVEVHAGLGDLDLWQQFFPPQQYFLRFLQYDIKSIVLAYFSFETKALVRTNLEDIKILS